MRDREAVQEPYAGSEWNFRDWRAGFLQHADGIITVGYSWKEGLISTNEFLLLRTFILLEENELLHLTFKYSDQTKNTKYANFHRLQHLRSL